MSVSMVDMDSRNRCAMGVTALVLPCSQSLSGRIPEEQLTAKTINNRIIIIIKNWTRYIGFLAF